jgi:cobalt-zinc-cadmium resistance protein CzcA
MFERIVTLSFNRPPLVILFAVAAAIFGSYTFSSLRRDVFPDLSAPVFNIIVQNASMSPEELEIGVAIPVESALAGLPDVRRIRSVNQLGVSQVTVEFEPDADYYRSRQLLGERVSSIAAQLPHGTDAPLISSLTGRLNEVFEFTLEAEPGTADLMALRDLAEFDVRNRLLAVPGVAAVERLGGYLRQFQVQLDPERMAARGVTLDEILHAVEGANVNVAGGFFVQGPMEWSVRAIGQSKTVEDLRETVVVVRGTTPVLLGDVADVREAPAVRRGIAHRLLGEVVSCRVVKQFGADTVAVSSGIRSAVEEIRRLLPKGIELRIVYDQSELIQSALGGVGRAVLLGAVFVVLVLVVMLGDLRAAFVVTLTIPISLALAAIFLRAAGVGLNTMTLGGLAIAVGILVDASIIVTENIVHRLSVREGKPVDVARDAAVEVGRPIAFATLIVIAVFLPIFGMTGIEGRMYEPLAAAVIASVSASLVLALTFVPVASAMLLRRKATSHADDVGLIRKVKQVYEPILAACMRRSGAVVLATVVITIPGLALGLMVGSEFMPKLDEGAFLIQTLLPPEASLDEVDRLNHRAEDSLREFPEVEDVVRRTGRAERTEDPMPHVLSDVLVVLRKDRRRSLQHLETKMREAVQKVPGVVALFTTPLGMRIDEGLGGTPADISVRIFGPDLDELARLGESARQIVKDVRGVTDLRVEQLTGLPQLRMRVDRPALARVGLTPGDVLRAVRIGLVGEEMSEIWVGQRHFDLVVKLQDRWRNDPHAVRGLLIDGHDGTKIPLGQLVAIEEVTAPGAIRREAGTRRIAVEGGVSGRDLGSVAADIRRHLAEKLTLPSGYFFDVGGRVESQERAARSLEIAVALAVLAVFVLLYLAVGSLAETFVILATLPSAFVGGIVAILLANETWNVSSLVGLIGLFGIAVQNGLVLVAQTRSLRSEGMPFEEALREASVSRVRPKLMTASTAILGLLPLLLLNLHGTEIERPLAIVMIGGLVSSTVFTLIALPTFYLWLHRLIPRRQGAASDVLGT